MPQKRQIHVVVVPTTGAPVTKTVDIARTGKVSVEEVLASAGVSSEKKSLSVLRPTSVTVGPDDTVNPGETITVTERPQGS